MINVLFVCLGNICRSPLAEAIFKKKVADLGLSNVISSNSVGTSNYHIGDDPDSRSIEVAVMHGVPIQHKGQQLNYKDATEYEYILVMDDANLRDTIHTLGEKPQGLYKMRDFDPDDKGAEVPDPYYGGKDGFENIFQILDRSINHFLDFVKKNHDL